MEACLPEGLEYATVFRDYETAMAYFEDPTRNHKTVLLFLLRFGRLLGILESPNTNESTDMQRLRKAVETFSMEKILRITGITEATVRELTEITGKSFGKYLG